MKKRKGNIAILLCVMLICSTLFSSGAIFAETGVDEGKSTTETKIEKTEATAAESKAVKKNTLTASEVQAVGSKSKSEEPLDPVGETTETTEPTTETSEPTTEETQSTTETSEPTTETTKPSANEPSKPVPEPSSSFIKDYMDEGDLVLKTSDDKPYDSSKGDKMNPSATFFIQLTFSELANGRQFPEDGVMTYQIPTDQIKGFNEVKNEDIKGTLDGEKKIVGKYSITLDGKITVDLDDDIVREFGNLVVSLTFEGSFKLEQGGTSEDIILKFEDGTTITVKFEDVSNLKITKDCGLYDRKTNLIDYTVKVSTDYESKNVVVTDIMDSKLELVQGSLAVKDSDGSNVTYTSTNPLPAGAAWQINVGNMGVGAEYTITYQARLAEKELTHALNNVANGIYDSAYSITAKNTATAISDNSTLVEAKAECVIGFNKMVKKSAKAVGNQLQWTVTINTDKTLDLAGYTLTDTLGEGLTIDKDTQMTINGQSGPAWSILAGDSAQKWEYTFPETPSDYGTYTFIYRTNKPASGESVDGQKYTNKVTLTKGDKIFNGSATYDAKGVEYLKVAFSNQYGGNSIVYDTDTGETYIRWTHLITVPTTGLENVVLTDWIATDQQPHEIPANLDFRYGIPQAGDKDYNMLVVDGVTKDEAPATIERQPDGKQFVMKFDSLPKSETPYKVRISGYTKVTGDKDGNRKNWGSLTAEGCALKKDWEDCTTMKVNMSGSKGGKYNSDDTIDWAVKFKTEYASLTEDVVIEDELSGDNQQFIEGSKVTLIEGSTSTSTEFTPEIISGTKLKVNVGKLKPNTDYTLKYQTKAKAEALAEQKLHKFINNAKVITGAKVLPLTATVEMSNKMIDKKLSQEPNLSNKYKAGFEIMLNPEEKMLNSSDEKDPNTYLLVDNLSKTMALDMDSIKVVKVKAGTSETLTEGYTASYDDTDPKSNILTISIDKADGFKYIITYTATVQGQVGQEVKYTNKATLTINDKKDGDDAGGSTVIKKQTSSAGAEGNTLAIYVKKVDGANLKKALPGAEFELYKDSVEKGNLLGRQTTGPGGMATFGQVKGEKSNLTTSGGRTYNLTAGVKYILKESKAPEGYEVNATEKEFQILGNDTNGDVNVDTKIEMRDTITIMNKKHNFDIQKADENGNPLTGAEFTLYTDSGCTQVHGEPVKGDSEGLFTFKNLSDGTYYLKETKIPDKYADPGKVYKIEIKDGNLFEVDDNDPQLVDRVWTIKNTKEVKGSITVTKQVKTNGSLTSSDKTYYAALFLDKELKDPVGDPKPLVMNGKDATSVTFDDLELGKTYYVAETDKGGTALTSTNNGLGATITYDKQNVDLTKERPSGAVTITNNYTIVIPPPSQLGSIKVTKEVKQDGVALDTDNTYYVALFNNSNLTNKVGTPKPLEMKGNDSTTVTFDNLPINATYYVAETDANGVPLPNQDNSIGATITYENQVVTLDANHLTADSKITNSYVSEYYWAGSIDVTKRVTISGTDTATDYVFYAGIYTDEGCTQRVGDIQSILMNGSATATVSFPDLPLGTYYVAETDAKGNVITDAKEQLGCELTINNSKITLTEEATEGSAELVNNYEDTEDFYKDGKLTVNKTTTYNGKAYNTNDVYYVALFADKAHSDKVTDVQALEMNGKNTAEVSFEGLLYGTYYLAETDENGKALTDIEAAKRGFTSVVNQTVEVGDEPTTIDLENQLTQEYVDNNGGNNNSNTGNTGSNTGKTGNNNGTATQTGDTADMTPVVICMIMALIAMGAIVIKRRREIKK